MTTHTDELSLSSERMAVRVDLVNGGRINSLRVDGTELLWTPPATEPFDPLLGGLYPMVPFAGRIRDGRFSFDDALIELPQTLGRHAIHGYGYVRQWKKLDAQTIRCDFDSPWPFAGYVTQHFALSERELTITMTVHALDRQPVQLGWHPWFRRQTERGEAALNFSAREMFARDHHGMPGEPQTEFSGPFDDCFTGVEAPPTISWGHLCVELISAADYWVVFDEPSDAICVEPQSGPPNEFNTAPQVLEAGEQRFLSFTIRLSNEV